MYSAVVSIHNGGMFFAIPVEHKPSLKALPLMTILLIAINVLVYFGWQVREESAVQEAAQYYAKSALPALEMPRLLEYAKRRAEIDPSQYNTELAAHIEEAFQKEAYADLYVFMWQEQQFRKELLAGNIIRPEDEQYAAWQLARSTFSLREPQPFTARWSQDYGLQSVSEILARPFTLLTSIFLHGSFSHLLGNMVFLFIFGFTLEASLGAARYLLFYLLSGIGASIVAAWAYAGTDSYGLGASGAIAGLMGMYAMLYRLRRIKFFYYILFYFNYARLPALVMLPVWMGYELLQNWLSDDHVAYMAHFGGLLSGSVLLAIAGLIRPQLLLDNAQGEPATAHQSEDTHWQKYADRARAQADALDFESACKSWRAIAKLRPKDAQVLQSWFEIARHWPASDDFHAAACMVFQLHARDDEIRRLQQHVYQVYLEQAKPVIRLRPSHMVQLARSFIALQDLENAERLCRLLEKQAPDQPELPQILTRLANAWAKTGHTDKALAWLAVLQQRAPRDPITLWLAGR